MVDNLGIEIEGLEAARRKLGKMAGELDAKLDEAMRRSVLMVERAAKEEITRSGAINTGRLRSSITSEVRGMGGDIKGLVGSNVVYAPYVELGTRPHWPPFAPISYWVMRKLGIPQGDKAHYMVVRGVQRGIARFGTRAREFFQEAIKEKGEAVRKEFERAIGELLGE